MVASDVLVALAISVGLVCVSAATPTTLTQAMIFLQQSKEKESSVAAKTDLLSNFRDMYDRFDSGKLGKNKVNCFEKEEVKEDVVDICQNPSIDAATRSDGHIYFFKGNYYWQSKPFTSKLDVTPRNISTDWKGLQGHLDAAVTLSDGTYFFKGHQYWHFRNKRLVSGYPKLIGSEFPGIPDNLDGAVVWGKNNRPYFFKDSNYWRFDNNEDPQVNKDYPLPIGKWLGVPDNIDAAFLAQDGQHTYFFKGKHFYKYSDIMDRVEPEYPRLISDWWFDCKPM